MAEGAGRIMGQVILIIIGIVLLILIASFQWRLGNEFLFERPLKELALYLIVCAIVVSFILISIWAYLKH